MALLSGAFQVDGINPLELLLLLLYAILFAWICTSFWTATVGFLVLLCRIRRWAITAMPGGDRVQETPLGPTRTALLMPVYNEDPARVFASVKAIWRSLAATGQRRALISLS